MAEPDCGHSGGESQVAAVRLGFVLCPRTQSRVYHRAQRGSRVCHGRRCRSILWVGVGHKNPVKPKNQVTNFSSSRVATSLFGDPDWFLLHANTPARVRFSVREDGLIHDVEAG
jgi:hypothetical protein